MLAIQRRMHPSISNLLRSTIYPDLVDGPNVSDYPFIPGMRRRLFWFDHDQLEVRKQADSPLATSHSNDFEVEMTVALVSHLNNQGCYRSGDIAVLTPYLGQMRKLRSALSSHFAVVLGDLDEDLMEQDDRVSGGSVEQSTTPAPTKVKLSQALRIATVDNFQGEEAKCVVVSLVRSNKEGRCGFLRTSNRINVLLSRAQHGMYLIGNSNTYSSVDMWNKVIEILGKENNIGKALELCCPRHPETPISVRSPNDFATLAPEGGCNLRCVNRLGCGHACPSKCHSEALHQVVRCLEPCTKTRGGCDLHPCPKPCGDPCASRCDVKIPRVELPCGHIQTTPCYQTKNLEHASCRQLIEWTFDSCKHTINIPCHRRHETGRIQCTSLCNDLLPCGHQCKKLCNSCCYKDRDSNKMKKNHGTCEQICGRDYSTCQHSCQAKCHPGMPCGLCKMECQSHCVHSACGRMCCEPCAPCAQAICPSQCPHCTCSMPCGAPCDWIPCGERCTKMLECGHQCPSLCGEICPPTSYCQTCCDSEIKGHVVDFIMMETYVDIDLDEDPCIFPRCGHFLTKSSMDGNMGMNEHYDLDQDGNVLAIKTHSQPFDTVMKTCSTCRASLGDIARYGRIVRRALLDESSKRLITWAQQEQQNLQEAAFEVEEHLAATDSKCSVAEPLLLRGSPNDQFGRVAKLMRKVEEYKQVNGLTTFHKRFKKP